MILYKKGIPANLLRMEIPGKPDPRLCYRRSGQLGKFVQNTTGVFQRSPKFVQNAHIKTIPNAIRGANTEI